MHGIHYRNSKVVKQVVGLHKRSPRVVELEVGLYYRCPGSNQEVSQGGEANDKTSL